MTLGMQTTLTQNAKVIEAYMSEMRKLIELQNQVAQASGGTDLIDQFRHELETLQRQIKQSITPQNPADPTRPK